MTSILCSSLFIHFHTVFSLFMQCMCMCKHTYIFHTMFHYVLPCSYISILCSYIPILCFPVHTLYVSRHVFFTLCFTLYSSLSYIVCICIVDISLLYITLYSSFSYIVCMGVSSVLHCIFLFHTLCVWV